MTSSNMWFALEAVGIVAGAAVVWRFAIAVEKWLRCLDDAICRLQTHRQRKKKDRRRWRQRWRNRLEPLQRHIPAALSYTLYVLLLSAFAPLLFVVFDQAMRSWMDAPYSIVTANILVAAVAGFTTALIVSSLRGDRIKFAERMLDGLAAGTTPDNGVDADKIDFIPQQPLRHSETTYRYYNIRQGSGKAAEWLITLRQVHNAYAGRYTIESLCEQITALEQWHQQIKTAIEKCGICCRVPAMNTVCFISNKGRFHALQDYKVFRNQIMDRGNKAYLMLLNETHEDKFWQIIDDNMQRAKPQTAAGATVHYPDAIPGLECFWIEKGTSREGSLHLLIGNKKARAMLVRDQREGTPLGTVSLETLAEQILFQPLDDGQLAQSALPDANHSRPPGLA